MVARGGRWRIPRSLGRHWCGRPPSWLCKISSGALIWLILLGLFNDKPPIMQSCAVVVRRQPSLYTRMT